MTWTRWFWSHWSDEARDSADLWSDCSNEALWHPGKCHLEKLETDGVKHCKKGGKKRDLRMLLILNWSASSPKKNILPNRNFCLCFICCWKWHFLHWLKTELWTTYSQSPHRLRHATLEEYGRTESEDTAFYYCVEGSTAKVLKQNNA